MQRSLVLAVGILLVVQVGCASMNGSSHLISPSYKISGSLTKPVGCATYGFVNGSEIEVGEDTLKRRLEVNELIKTRHIVKLDIVARPSTNYAAVLGPNFGSTEYATAHIRNPVPRIYLDCGWLYLTGTGIAGETKWVSAGADGSKMAIQILKAPGGDIHRVFYFEGTRGTYKLGTAAETEFPHPDMYVDITASGVLAGPSVILPGTPPATFKAEMEKIQTAIAP